MNDVTTPIERSFNLGDVGDAGDPPVDSPVADTAPKRTPRAASVAASELPPPPKATQLEKKLAEMFAGMGAVLLPFDDVCAKAIVMQAPALADSLDQLAKTSPRVKKALEGMLTGGGWASVMIAAWPIVMTVLAHHGALPPHMTASLGIEVRTPRKHGADTGADTDGEVIHLHGDGDGADGSNAR